MAPLMFIKAGRLIRSGNNVNSSDKFVFHDPQIQKHGSQMCTTINDSQTKCE